MHHTIYEDNPNAYGSWNLMYFAPIPPSKKEIKSHSPTFIRNPSKTT